ncbi:DUF6350 family protein [Nocardioides yefusunii]|uniref:DUF6350 family protein n=1 Tax=Nocardioides yefusunii TaxID=2500546 RepID=A0ABW1QZU3_9ACTN
MRGEGFSAQRPHRPTALLGLLAGAGAALLGIVVCAVIGLVGWYLSDAGGHGAPREGVAAGTRAWLVGHGAGLEVNGVAITLLPLGITLMAAWLSWQASLRLGEAVWNHGPDEARRGDGERDFTVLLATGGFTAGYLTVAVLALSAVSSPQWQGSVAGVVRWSLLFGVVVAGAGVLLGSGRVRWWAERVPVAAQDAFAGAWELLRAWFAVSALLFVVAMVVGYPDAAEIVRSLGTSPSETTMLVLACVVLLPQAVLWSSAFLLGPGFQVGTATAVAPSGVVLGPLPLVPILGALPDDGPAPGWWAVHLAVPVLLAAALMVRRQVTLRITGWTHAAVAGLGAGLLASIVLAVLTAMADGAAGPGRMAEVGVSGTTVLVAAAPLFCLGTLLGALAGTWWVRRGGVPVDPSESVVGEPSAEDAQETPVDETPEPESAAEPERDVEPAAEPELEAELAVEDEPAAAEPTDAEPTDAEPTDAEPTDAEPTDAEPTDAEPTDVEPTDAEPTDAEELSHELAQEHALVEQTNKVPVVTAPLADEDAADAETDAAEPEPEPEPAAEPEPEPDPETEVAAEIDVPDDVEATAEHRMVVHEDAESGPDRDDAPDAEADGEADVEEDVRTGTDEPEERQP